MIAIIFSAPAKNKVVFLVYIKQKVQSATGKIIYVDGLGVELDLKENFTNLCKFQFLSFMKLSFP